MKKLLLILGAVITFCAVIPYALALTPQFQYDPSSTLTTSLVSYYNMQGNSNDYWGTNNGSDSNMTYGTSYGKVNEGANFNGSNSKISYSSPIINQAQKSFNLWFNPASTPSSGEIVLFDAGTTGSNGWFLDMCGDCNPKVLRWGPTDGSGPTANYALSNFTLGTWYMITGTSDSSGNGVLYVNGTQVGTGGPGTYTSSAYNMGIGYSTSLNARYFNGDMDEVAFWTKILSANEITDLYNGGAGQTMCNGTGGPVCSTGSSPKMSFNWITLNWKPEPIA